MTRPPRGQELYRRMLAIVGAVVALAITSCGTPAGVAAGPTPGPVTADSIRAAVNNSMMNSAHFRLHGTLIKNRTYYPFTGGGVLQLRPVEALDMTVNLQTFTGKGSTSIRELTIDGRIYTRVGTGKWASAVTGVSPIAMTSYVGEEIIDGKAVWHARTEAPRTTYDVWVRESDGFIVQIKYAGISGTFTMNFDIYNKSREIVAPKN